MNFGANKVSIVYNISINWAAM